MAVFTEVFSSRWTDSTVPITIPGTWNTEPMPLVTTRSPWRTSASRGRNTICRRGPAVPCTTPFQPVRWICAPTPLFRSLMSSTVEECGVTRRTWPTNPRGVITICFSRRPSAEPASIMMLLNQFVGFRPMTLAARVCWPRWGRISRKRSISRRRMFSRAAASSPFTCCVSVSTRARSCWFSV